MEFVPSVVLLNRQRFTVVLIFPVTSQMKGTKLCSVLMKKRGEVKREREISSFSMYSYFVASTVERKCLNLLETQILSSAWLPLS